MAQVQIVSDGVKYRHQIRSGEHVLLADEPVSRHRTVQTPSSPAPDS